MLFKENIEYIKKNYSLFRSRIIIIKTKEIEKYKFYYLTNYNFKYHSGKKLYCDLVLNSSVLKYSLLGSQSNFQHLYGSLVSSGIVSLIISKKMLQKFKHVLQFHSF